MSRFYYSSDEYVEPDEKDPDSYYSYCDCPSVGSFIAWKVVAVLKQDIEFPLMYCLAQLKIPAESPRLRAKNSKKCRCKFAEVLGIQNFAGVSLPDYIAGYSMFELTGTPEIYYSGIRTIYEKGKTVYADCFDDDRHNECSNGIHFFMNREDAISYASTWR